jgi:hypothetical protein
MKRPNITPEDWQFNGSTVFALTPYRGDSPKVAKLCPEGINRFSCRVSADNSEQSGGASQAEIDANTQFIAAAPDMAKALEDTYAAFSALWAIHARGAQNDTLDAAKAALIKAGYTF